MTDAIQLAIYNTVHDYRYGKSSGATALAPRVGFKSAGYLSNQASLEMPDHQLSLVKSVPIQIEANDYRIADAYCMTLGGVFLRFPDFKFVSDQHLFDIYTKLAEEEGETAGVIRRALDSGDIDDSEMASIDKEINEDIQVKLELRERLRSIHTQSRDRLT